MSVYFYNPGEIDLNVIRLMGVNIKETDSPIGYFGTGLKFAIATLLRTGHDVTLRVNGRPDTDFKARNISVRGETIQGIVMGDEPLSFTTSLGRDWDVWQAYRELTSNAIDECGGVSIDDPGDVGTVFIVSGASIDEVYRQRRTIFLEGEPLFRDGDIEVWPHNGTGYVYNRGIRVGSLPSTPGYTYNILSRLELTEDRSFKTLWPIEYAVERSLPSFIADTADALALVGDKDRWESGLDYQYCTSPSRGFVEAAQICARRENTNPSLVAFVAKHVGPTDYGPATTSHQEEETIRLALAASTAAGATLTRRDIVITDELPEGVLGMCRVGTGQVFMSRRGLPMGWRQVAATIFEEYAHKEHRLVDYSRGFQDFMINHIISLAAANNAASGPTVAADVAQMEAAE